ncbi:MAG: cysteine desulfurase family protein [Lachnospiraceae bacterium]|nr:cysteine desulfurase family protein [Lachnospiraceae bacterium]
MKEIYFDNSSTTVVSPEAARIVMKVMTEDYGNPSSMHLKGVAAEKYVREARVKIAKTLRAKENEIYFTSGGSESTNWALIGGALANRRAGNTILTSAFEHPAVSEPLKFLESQGFHIERIPVDHEGRLRLDVLREKMTEDVILLSFMYVNNEIGAVNPVEEIGKMKTELCPKALFHVDAIQAYGKYRICPKELKIDLLSVSGHKLHGPKGTGFLYKAESAKLLPLIYGGGQQGGMRSGTENVPGAAGLGVACEEAYTDFEENVAYLRKLKARLVAGLREIPDTVIHGMPGDEGAPHIVNAAFLGAGSEVLLHTLEDRGIYISAGSACSTHKRAGSPTLTAIGASKAEMESSVRFSFSELNTEEEVDEALTVLREVLPVLRRYRRK